MCAQTRPRFILSSEGVFGGMEFQPMLTPREKKSPLPENFPRGGWNPQRCEQRAQTLPTSYSGPQRPSICRCCTVSAYNQCSRVLVTVDLDALRHTWVPALTSRWQKNTPGSNKATGFESESLHCAAPLFVEWKGRGLMVRECRELGAGAQGQESGVGW